jgi:hypothetical protein
MKAIRATGRPRQTISFIVKYLSAYAAVVEVEEATDRNTPLGGAERGVN